MEQILTNNNMLFGVVVGGPLQSMIVLAYPLYYSYFGNPDVRP
jgi:hypothetical protein